MKYLALILTLVSACADRPTDISLDEMDTMGPAPGEPLSGCIDVGDCFDEWCVHPAGETGFCTYACDGGPESCPSAPSGTAVAICLSVAEDEVCALDCGGGRSCPVGMRCEQIDGGGGTPQEVCF